MPELQGQTVVVIGGSAGIGLETARRARAEGADVVLTGRDHERLGQAAAEVDAGSVAAFDATDPTLLDEFFRGLPDPIDHVLVTAGRPHYASLLEMDLDDARARPRRARAVGGPGQLGTPSADSGPVARSCSWAAPVRGIPASAWASCRPSPPRCRRWWHSLALEAAPVRVNLIAPGFVDTPLSASLLGDDLDDAARPAPRHAPDRARRRTRRRRRARGPPHEQHRGHRRDLRHRRRSAARRRA